MTFEVWPIFTRVFTARLGAVGDVEARREDVGVLLDQQRDRSVFGSLLEIVNGTTAPFSAMSGEVIDDVLALGGRRAAHAPSPRR